jgi:exosortase/archaeosortase family protein
MKHVAFKRSLGALHLLNRIGETLRKLVIPLSFTLPIATLYLLDPIFFESTWKGRTPHLIFLWLLFLELALAWRKLGEQQSAAPNWFKRVMIAIMAAAPIAYVFFLGINQNGEGLFFFGISSKIVELGNSIGIPFGRLPPMIEREWFPQVSWPLSLEYIFFTVFFAASLLLMYGWRGPKRFSVSLFFIGATGGFYMIDTFYPYGTFTFLQALAPVTAYYVVNILNWLGYKTRIMGLYQGMPVLDVAGLSGPPPAIAWGCAGIQSLFIYTFVILFFLRNSPFPLSRKAIRVSIPKRLKLIFKNKRISFLLKWEITHTAIIKFEVLLVNFLRFVPIYIIVVIGAIGTFIVNVLRIVSFCIIGVDTGRSAADLFHKYYGELYFIAWVIAYLLIIIYGGQILTKMSAVASKLKGS